jgi:hypothetical protein
MNFTFTPTSDFNAQLKVPYFEEARANFAPYYDVRHKTLIQAQAEVSAELAKLGAGVQSFQDGIFQAGKTKRHGYNIRFNYGGGQGIIRVAGLPFHHDETPRKIERVKLQALLNVRDWLKAAITNRIFSPGADILIPFMLVDFTPGHERTVAEYIAEKGQLPQLNPPPNGAQSLIEEGDIVDG